MSINNWWNYIWEEDWTDYNSKQENGQTKKVKGDLEVKQYL